MNVAVPTLAMRLAALAIRLAAEFRQCVRPSHPGLARAWASFGVMGGKSAGEVRLHAAYNVTSVTRLEKGRYRICFAEALPDVHYAWLAFARNAGRANAIKIASARTEAEVKHRAYVELIVTTTAGTQSDSTEINLVVFR